MIHVVLYNPEIPQNTGNIMRTCGATDVILHLIKPLGFEFDPKYLKRDAANYLDTVEYYIHENFESFLKENSGRMYFITRYGQKAPSEFDFKLKESTENIYFIFGSESSGIPKELLSNNFDNCLRLPMNSKVRSLNLSNTVAIIVYEALRQNDYLDLSLEEPSVGEGFKGKDYLKKV